MIPVFQTRYGAKKGNCFQAALASLFELELETVPDFCNKYSVHTDEWYIQFLKWLNKRGYTSIVLKDNLERPNYKDCYLLVSGKNADGVNHCVIYRNGKPVHNPNRYCKGIEPETIDIIFPLNPTRKIQNKG